MRQSIRLGNATRGKKGTIFWPALSFQATFSLARTSFTRFYWLSFIASRLVL